MTAYKTPMKDFRGRELPVSLVIVQEGPDTFTYKLTLYGRPQGGHSYTGEAMKIFLENMASVTGWINYRPSLSITDGSDMPVTGTLAQMRKTGTIVRIGEINGTS